jgi:hypothetical protein
MHMITEHETELQNATARQDSIAGELREATAARDQIRTAYIAGEAGENKLTAATLRVSTLTDAAQGAQDAVNAAQTALQAAQRDVETAAYLDTAETLARKLLALGAKSTEHKTVSAAAFDAAAHDLVGMYLEVWAARTELETHLQEQSRFDVDALSEIRARGLDTSPLFEDAPTNGRTEAYLIRHANGIAFEEGKNQRIVQPI